MKSDKSNRYHDLDALRAFAMLLGIFLHGLLSFFPNPIWPGQDIYQHKSYETLLHIIHGFRMPLFFLVSGFFTAMMWRKRGLGGLFKHRINRIFVPMIVFGIIVIPLNFGIGAWGNSKKLTNKEAISTIESDLKYSKSIIPFKTLDELKKNNLFLIKQAFQDGLSPNSKDTAGVPILNWAASYNYSGMVELILDSGGDPDICDNKKTTALMMTGIFGADETSEILIKRGADINLKNEDGSDALIMTSLDWGIVSFIGNMMRIPLDKNKIIEGRLKVAEKLKNNGANPQNKNFLVGFMGNQNSPEWVKRLFSIIGGVWFLSVIPVFHHLWFLYYLLWLVVGFIIVTWVSRKLNFKKVPDILLKAPFSFLWLVPFTFVFQSMMFMSFGPDTNIGIIPWPPTLLYYGVFFGFGAVCFNRDVFETKYDKSWPIFWILSIPIFMLALHFFDTRNNSFGMDWVKCHIIYAFFTVIYTWLLIFGFIGIFSKLFSIENSKIRYLSDSSYWLYIMHLPLIQSLQIIVSQWNIPSYVKLFGTCTITILLLLLIYELVIRYTWLGAMLNGRKYRNNN